MTKRWAAMLSLGLAMAGTAAAGPLAYAAQAGSSAQATPAAASARPVNAWGHEGSDLQPDPAARFGVLPNGMRYLIYRNATPPGEVSMRLRFAVGKLYGPDERHGLAHFIEHMAFNGSTNVPEGEITKRLERIGLRFGADSNAATSPTQTVYQLDVPNATDEKLDVAFLYMRELAGELNFAPAALERERGIIQSEERSQYTPARLAFNAEAAFLLKNQLAGRRNTIGDPNAIRTGARDTFVDIYRRYYRPERASFIVVGDVDPDKMEAEIRRRFSTWTASGAPGEEPDLGRLAQRGLEAETFIGSGVPGGVSMNWLRPYEGRPDTRAERIRELRENLAFAVLNRRFARLVEAGAAPFTDAGAGDGEILRSAEITSVNASPIPGREAESVRVVEQEVRRAVQYGVLQPELDREIAQTRSGLQAAVAGAATRRSAALASAFAQSVDQNDVILSPAQRLALFEEAVKGFTAAQAGEALKGRFEGSGPLVFATSPTPISGGDKALAAAVTESRKMAVAPPVAIQAKAWAYTNFGPAGRVVERMEFADVGVTRVKFANGVTLLVRPSPLRKDQVLVNARIGGGRLALPKDLVTWPVTQGAFVSGGLGKLTEEERKQALSGKVYDVGLSVADEGFNLSGATRPEDLAVQMQVLAAYTTDPGWRAEPFARTKKQLQNLMSQIETRPFNVAMTRYPRLVRSNDGRWGLPVRSELDAADLTPVRAVLDPALARAPIEVLIVGDVTVDQAIAQTAATFGALPARKTAPRLPGSDRVALAPAAGPPVRTTHAGRPDVALGLVSWRTDDFFDDVREVRVLQVLRAVVELRALDKLREELGSTYSPIVTSETSEVFDEIGLLTVMAEVKQDTVPALMKAIEEVAADLAAKGPTEDELNRARTPLLATLARDRAGNEYWLSQLGGASWDPRRLERTRTAEADLKSVTLADLKRAAAAYLRPDRAWRMVVDPSAAPAAPAAAAGAAG